MIRSLAFVGLSAFALAIHAATPVFTVDLNRKIATAAANGGGRVVVGPGRYLSGTIRMESNVELHLEQGAEVLGVADQDAYPVFPNAKTVSQKNRFGWCSLVYAEGVTNIAITGMGTIDGQGSLQKGRPGLNGDLDCRARGILFVTCRNVTVRDIRLRNAGMWTQHFFDCEDVLVENLNVFSRANHNNDGIDIDSCRRFVVRNCTIDSADDAIVLKTTSFHPCEDVLVERCVISSQAAGFKIGTETLGDVRRVRVRDIRVSPSNVKTAFNHSKGRWRGIDAIAIVSTDGAEVSDVDIDGVQAAGQECAFFMRVGNRCRPVSEGGGSRAPGSIRHVRIANLKSEDTGILGSSIVSFEHGRISDVVLENIQIDSVGGVGEGDYTTLGEFRTWSDSYPSALSLGNVPAKGLFLYGVDEKSVAVRSFAVASKIADVRPLRAAKCAVEHGVLERYRHELGSDSLCLGYGRVPYAFIRFEEGAYVCALIGEDKIFQNRVQLASALAREAHEKGWAGVCLPARRYSGDPEGVDREMVQILHDSGFYVAVWYRGSLDESYCREVGVDGAVEFGKEE